MTWEPGLAIDAGFSTFGEDVVIDPDGSPVTVRAIRSAPDSIDQFGSARFRSETVTLKIRAADAAGLQMGSLIDVGSERREVQQKPRYDDPLRLVALVDTVKVAVVQVLTGSSVSAGAGSGSLADEGQIFGSTAVAVASAAGGIDLQAAIAAAVATTASGAGALERHVPVVGGTAATGTATGALSGQNLSGTTAASASASGAVSASRPVAGSSSATATCTGALADDAAIGGSTSAVASCSGTVDRHVPLIGSSAAVATDSGAVERHVPLGGSSAAAASCMGVLNEAPVGQNQALSYTVDEGGAYLAGSSAASATGSTGAVSHGAPLSGSSSAVATGAGAMERHQPVAGSAAAVASNTGVLTDPAHSLAGTSAAVGMGTGAISHGAPLTGSSAAIATGTGALTDPAADPSYVAAGSGNAIDWTDSVSVNMPTHAAGDTLIHLVNIGAGGTSTTPSGFTLEDTIDATGAGYLEVYSGTAASSSDTITHSFSSNVDGTAVCYSFRDVGSIAGPAAENDVAATTTNTLNTTAGAIGDMTLGYWLTWDGMLLGSPSVDQGTLQFFDPDHKSNVGGIAIAYLTMASATSDAIQLTHNHGTSSSGALVLEA